MNKKGQAHIVIIVIALILFMGAAIFFIGQFAGWWSWSVAPSCDETAYSSFSWRDNTLIYSGVFGVNICGGESSSPRGGTTLTANHNYAVYYGAPYFGWAVIQSNCEGVSYPCITETAYNFVFPPAEIVKKYPSPETAATNMECRVYGSTAWFGNSYGDVFSVSIPYDIKGKEVKWLGKERGFRCIIDIPSSIQEEFIRQANANGCWGHICSMIYNSAPVVQGSVEFTFKQAPDPGEQCTNQELKCGGSCPSCPAWQTFLQKFQEFLDWMKDLFKNAQFWAISGSTSVQPGSTETYSISLTAPVPDSDYTDGSYQIQYASWALIDKDENIKQQGEWEKVQGSYQKQVTINVPSELNKFGIAGVIVQYDMQYNFSTKQWSITKEDIVAKEMLNVATKLPVPFNPPVPGWSKIADWFKSFLDWLAGLFK